MVKILDLPWLSPGNIDKKQAPNRGAKALARSQSAKARTSYPASKATFASSKKDKQMMKRSLLLSRIEKSNQKPTKKRRRPNKKLSATLESLADALPDISHLEEAANGEQTAAAAVTKARRNKSLRTRPGSMKRKQKVEKAERERFGMNIAQLASLGKGGSSNSALSGLDAIKKHIATHMQHGG